MNKYEALFTDIKKDLDLIAPELKEWNQRYFSAHEKRYESDIKIIEKYYNSGDILEIGSIPYHMTCCLKKLGYPVFGLDLKPDRAKKLIDKYELIVRKCNVETEKIPFEDSRFSFIVFNEIFEHLRIDPISTLREINRVLESNGIIVLTTPNLYSLSTIISFSRGQGFNNPYEEFQKLHNLGHMGHVREYSTKEVRQFLENTGFELIDVEYKAYNQSNHRKIIVPIVNLFHNTIPASRPFQVVIAKKSI